MSSNKKQAFDHSVNAALVPAILNSKLLYIKLDIYSIFLESFKHLLDQDSLRL